MPRAKQLTKRTILAVQTELLAQMSAQVDELTSRIKELRAHQEFLSSQVATLTRATARALGPATRLVPPDSLN